MITVNKIRKLASHVLLASTVAGLVACSGGGALDQTPKGALSAGQVTTPGNLDGLVTAAYSWIGNDHYTNPNFFWPTGNLRGGDAHKGGNGPGDVFYYHALQMYNLVTPQGVDVNSANRYWVRWYDGISRVNTALAAIAPVSSTDYPAKDGRVGELHFIRGVFYFWLKTHFDRVPWIDETVSPTAVVSNTALSSQALWDKIIADFQAAATSLPATQSQVGRANKYAAESYLAKALLYAAYVQDPTTHAVTSIDQAKLTQVITMAADVEASGQYALMPDYALNFLPENDNNRESVFAIQRSINDNSAQGNGGRGTFASALNYPVGDSGFGCCGFHIPTQDFINSFKTVNGLPVDGYNGAGPAADYRGFPVLTAGGAVQQDAQGNDVLAWPNQTVDPRLDHSVVQWGQPFKYCQTAGHDCIHHGVAWARDPTTYGSTIGMKDLVARSSSALTLNGPFFISSMNTVLVRYADLELFKAEALIERNGAGDLAAALNIINAIRNRAAGSAGLLNTNPFASAHFNYDVRPYPAFATQAAARKALRLERRLELGLEGFRFFDLVRWGVAKSILDQYLADEVLRRPFLSAAHFTAGRDEYLPIPQQQVDLSGGVYTQNPGY